MPSAESTVDNPFAGLDAYGHLNWTVGDENWTACLDAVRVGDQIAYHVVVDCESGGFTDTPAKGHVPATAEGVADLRGLPDYWFDIGTEVGGVGNLEGATKAEQEEADNDSATGLQQTIADWNSHLDALIAEGA